MRHTLVALALVTLTACGTPSTDGPQAEPSATGAPAAADPEQKYVGQGLVLQKGDKAPEFCLGGANDSLPPQCSGPEIVGWDWDAVEGEESAGGTTWGSYQLTGYYDGTTFTVLLTSPPQEFTGEGGPRFETPCAEPPGGWKAEDPERATEADRSVAIEYAESQPEHAATWVDYIDEPSETTEPKDMILNVAFTDNAEQHEAEIRKLWGGPLCVIEKEGRTRAELSEIQN